MEPPKYIRQFLTVLEVKKHSNRTIVGAFTTPLTVMDRSYKQKVNKKTST